MPELLYLTGPVKAGRLVEVAGHGLESRQEDDHVIANILPEVRSDDAAQRQMRVAQPVTCPAFQMRVGQQRVERAKGRAENILPQIPNSQWAEQHRNQEQDA